MTGWRWCGRASRGPLPPMGGRRGGGGRGYVVVDGGGEGQQSSRLSSTVAANALLAVAPGEGMMGVAAGVLPCEGGGGA